MSYENFKYYSTRDLFEKAKRDYHIMENNLSVDAIFNFFATIYHLKEWVKFYHSHLKNDIEAYCRNENYFSLCEEICSKGKYIGTEGEVVHLDETYIESPLPSYDDYYEIIIDGIKHPVLEIGEILIKKIENFFKEYNIKSEN